MFSSFFRVKETPIESFQRERHCAFVSFVNDLRWEFGKKVKKKGSRYLEADTVKSARNNDSRESFSSIEIETKCLEASESFEDSCWKSFET